MKMIDIALKDSVRFFRSFFALGMVLAAPLVIVGLIYLAFGGFTGGSSDLPVVKVGIVNHDTPPEGYPSLGESFTAMLKDESVSRWVKVTAYPDESSARSAIDRQEINVAALVPADFSKAVLTGKGNATLRLLQDPTISIGPAIIKNMVTSLVDGAAGARIALEVAQARQLAQEPASMQSLAQSFQDWFTSFQRTLYHSPQAALVVQAPGSAAQQNEDGMRTIAMVMAGMLVFFSFYTGAYSMTSILREDEEGTLARLFTTPTARTTILAGKFLAVFLIVIVQSLVLMALSSLAFRVSWGEPLSVILAVTGQVVAAAGLGVLLISLVKSSRQSGPVLGGGLTVMAMLGGLFTVAVQMPPGFLTISYFIPQGWAMAGWKLAIHGSPPADLLAPLALMIAGGIVMFAIGARLFGKRFA